MFRCLRWFSCCIIAYSTHTLAAEQIKSQPFPISPFSAQYNILHKGDPVGKAVRALSFNENGNIHYSYHTDIEWLIFSDKRRESSTLTANNNTLTPLHYVFERTGTGRDKYKEWEFSPTSNQGFSINEDKEKHAVTIDFATPLQDKLSYHLQQRLNLIDNPTQKHFVYEVIQNSGKTKNYVYEFDAEEEIMLPYGNVKALRLKREVVEKKKTTYVWFAPELDYLLVRLRQIKGDVVQFEAQLNTYKPSK